MVRWLKYFDRDLLLVLILSIVAVGFICGFEDLKENITSIIASFASVFSGYSALKSIRGNTPQSESALRPSRGPRRYQPGSMRRWVLRPFQVVFDFMLDLLLLTLIALLIFSILIALAFLASPWLRSNFVGTCYAIEVIDLSTVCDLIGSFSNNH